MAPFLLKISTTHRRSCYRPVALDGVRGLHCMYHLSQGSRIGRSRRQNSRAVVFDGRTWRRCSSALYVVLTGRKRHFTRSCCCREAYVYDNHQRHVDSDHANLLKTKGRDHAGCFNSTGEMPCHYLQPWLVVTTLKLRVARVSGQSSKSRFKEHTVILSIVCKRVPVQAQAVVQSPVLR